MKRSVLLLFCTIVLNYASFSQGPPANFESLNPRFGSGDQLNITFNSYVDIDVMRARVIAIHDQPPLKTGSWPYEYIVYHNGAHGVWQSLLNDDIVMLFQAYQPNCDGGNGHFGTKSAHVFAWVLSSSAVNNTVTIRTDIPLTNTLIPLSFTSDDKVQILRINDWNNVTFNANSGPTCSAWDGETGGILAFLVKGTLTFAGDNIVFDVSEKGFKESTIDNRSHNNRTAYFATAGVAGTVDATGGGGTINHKEAPFMYRRIADGLDCINAEGSRSGLGTYMHKGTVEIGTLAVAPEQGCRTTVAEYVNFGNAGSPGTPGVHGAAAGGAGGAGASNNTNAGANGTNGTVATAGKSGYGGAGGRGGGLIMVYAYQYEYDPAITTNEIFVADGGAATIGGDGTGTGGDGGNGGDGADGYCNGSTYEMPGAGGLQGYGGNGADGGNGGDAGMPGHVRVYYNTALTASFGTSAVSVQPGYRGYGGVGSAHGDNGNPGNNGADDLNGTCVACYPVSIVKESQCNCAKALASIGKAADLADLKGGSMALNGSGSAMFSAKLNQEFNNDVNDYKIDATWWSDHSLLSVKTWEITQEGVSTPPPAAQVIQEKTYHCVLQEDDGTPYDVFSDLVSDMANSASWTNSFTANGTSTFGDFSFENDAVPQGGTWYKNGLGLASSRSCDQQGNTIDVGIPKDPEDGKNGSGGQGRQPEGTPPGNGRNGSDYPNNFGTDNVFFQGGITPGPPPVETLGQNPLTKEHPFVTIYPNPTSHTLSVELGKDQIIESVDVFDLSGRVVLLPDYTQNDNQTLRLDHLDVLLPGSYVLKIRTANKTYSGTFSVE